MSGGDRRFDGGNTRVPRGIKRPVEHVVVIGAGIAGLTIANALRNGGVECLVLEARDRIGGRLSTIALAGSPVDMGGSWIHHPVGNPLSAFADQIGVSYRPGNPLAALGGFDCGEGRRLSAAEVESSLHTQFERFPEAINTLRAALGPEASAVEAINLFVAREDLTLPVAKQTRQALRAVIEADAADLAERQSLRWLWNEAEYGGDYFGAVPAEGYQSLVAPLSTGLDIRLRVEVAQIVLSPDGVSVQGTDGATRECSHVVVTVPLGVLKRGALEFSPALDPDRMATIDRLGFGSYEKVALRFDRPFWRDLGVSHLMIFPRDQDLPAVWVFDLDAFGAGPILVAHLFHSVAERVLEPTPEAAVSWVLGLLAEALGRPLPLPVAEAVTTWTSDKYSGGAYTHIPPGADPVDVDLLGEPIGGRVLFAGEHTQSARLGYADGAMTSGIREAKRLLGRASVEVAPLTMPPSPSRGITQSPDPGSPRGRGEGWLGGDHC